MNGESSLRGSAAPTRPPPPVSHHPSSAGSASPRRRGRASANSCDQSDGNTCDAYARAAHRTATPVGPGCALNITRNRRREDAGCFSIRNPESGVARALTRRGCKVVPRFSVQRCSPTACVRIGNQRVQPASHALGDPHGIAR